MPLPSPQFEVMTLALNNYYNEIRFEAERSPHREICGFLLIESQSLKVRPAINVAALEEQSNNWAISSKEYIQAIETGRLFGMYHSHTLSDDESFSALDKQSAERAELPMFVYSIKTGKFNYYRPKACIGPYDDRFFIVGVQDCAALVMDYFEREFGAVIPPLVRPPEMIENGFANISEHCSDCFCEVKEPAKKGDLVVMSITGDEKLNHVGVLTEDDVILHQLMGRLSTRQTYTDSWKRLTKKVLRLK